MKKVLVLYFEYSETIDAIKYQLCDIAEVVCIQENYFSEEIIKDSDLVILLNCRKEYDVNALTVKHSLDIKSEESDPESIAILSGLKVTGITIFFSKDKKIIFQYPVFITSDMHYDNLKQELNYIEQSAMPVVIEKILKNEAFESKNILKSSCGGCAGCCH